MILTHCAVHSPHDLMRHIKQRPGCYLHGVLPGKVWSPAEWLNVKRLGKSYLDNVTARRAKSMSAFRNFVSCADECLTTGGRVSLVYPAYSAIWAQPEMIQFIHRHNLYSITIQKDKKAWRFLVSDKRQAEALGMKSKNAIPHPDVRTSASRRKADECDEEYDESWNHTLLSALFGHRVTAPAMPCVPPVIHPHREKESTCEGYGGATSSVSFGVWMDRKQQQDKVYAAVTRLLDRKEAHRDPAAIEAIKKKAPRCLSLKLGTKVP